MPVHPELFYNYLLISAGPEGTQLVQGIGYMQLPTRIYATSKANYKGVIVTCEWLNK